MGLLDFLFGTAAVMNVMNKRGNSQPQSIDTEEDDEAQFDDGYPDDYVGYGLDGADDYVGDGLDGSDDGEDVPQ